MWTAGFRYILEEERAGYERDTVRLSERSFIDTCSKRTRTYYIKTYNSKTQ